ncbi:MAG: winged helix-turn-helix transcriptional regulator [Actinobacteria bacterium]|nr:MAG: winged helix-turn-helix transcriptional regulator [Actinomycetota bacterium]
MSEGQFLKPGEALRDLRALEALDERPDISQRDLAARLGIAVGLTNACLRKMARKGWIKIKRVNSRNITYHLTPAGFSEKARLSVEFAGTTIDFYRRAKDTVSKTLAKLEAVGARRIVVLGATDLAEIIAVCAGAYEVKILAVVESDIEGDGRAIFGMTPIPRSEIPADFDALVVAETEGYQDRQAFVQKLAGTRLVAWPLESRIQAQEEVFE